MRRPFCFDVEDMQDVIQGTEIRRSKELGPLADFDDGEPWYNFIDFTKIANVSWRFVATPIIDFSQISGDNHRL